MTTEADDLRRRLDATTPRDTVRGLVFNATFELVREVAGAPAACEVDPGGEGKRRELFSYPLSDYLRVAWAACAALAQRVGPPERVFWELGSRCAERWRTSSLGRVTSAIVGVDPRSVLGSAPVGYRILVSSGGPMVEWVSERHARLVFERDFLPPSFHAGALARALQGVAGVQARAEGREEGFLRSVVEVSW